MQQTLIIYYDNDFYKIKIDSIYLSPFIYLSRTPKFSSCPSRTRLESAIWIVVRASIVIQIAFSDYETAVAVSQKFGQDEEERYRVCRRNRDRCTCTYFHCRCDKIFWREPISKYRRGGKKKRERERRKVNLKFVRSV